MVVHAAVREIAVDPNDVARQGDRREFRAAAAVRHFQIDDAVIRNDAGPTRGAGVQVFVDFYRDQFFTGGIFEIAGMLLIDPVDAQGRAGEGYVLQVHVDPLVGTGAVPQQNRRGVRVGRREAGKRARSRQRAPVHGHHRVELEGIVGGAPVPVDVDHAQRVIAAFHELGPVHPRDVRLVHQHRDLIKNDRRLGVAHRRGLRRMVNHGGVQFAEHQFRPVEVRAVPDLAANGIDSVGRTDADGMEGEEIQGQSVVFHEIQEGLNPFIPEGQVRAANESVRVAGAQTLDAITIELGIDLNRTVVKDLKIGFVPDGMVGRREAHLAKVAREAVHDFTPGLQAGGMRGMAVAGLQRQRVVAVGPVAGHAEVLQHP